MVFKTWLTGLNDVQKAINNISTLSTTANGATHLFSNSAVVQQYASALNGLNKEQALLALSYKNLSTQQKEQILAQMGLIASENTIQSELLQTTLAQKGVSEEKSKAILVELGLMNAETGEILSQKACTKADLEAILAQKGITGAQAEGIISALGLGGANAGLTASFELLRKAILGTTTALLSNPITWVIAGLAGVVTVAHQCSKAIEEVETKAQELNEAFSTSKTEIEDYKTQIDDLHKIINDSGSSIEEVTTARQNLMTIQDQLIEKFGDEKDTIDLITDAINGQTDALNILTEAQWQAAKNEFNESGFWNDVANGIDGYSNNIDRMLGEYEGYTVSIDMSEYGGTLFTEGREEFEKMLQDEFGAIQQGSSQTFTLSGDVSEVREKLLDIQEILKENSTYKPDDTFSDYLGGLERSADDVIEKYEDFYKQYVLYEEIFTNDTFTDSYKKINDAYSQYQDAFATGDEESIKKAQDNFANILTHATEGVSDESVVDFFNDMYPDLQEEVGTWKFETNFTANTDGLKDDVSGYLSGLDGLYSYDLQNFNYDTATEEQKASYDGLISVARLYGLTIDQLIDKLVLMGLVQDEEYQQLVDKFGKENVAKIAPEDLTYAYQIKNIGDMSFEELQAEIQRLKDEAQNPDETTVSSPTPFLDKLYTEDYEDTFKELTKLAEAGELTPKTLSSTEEYNALLKDTSTSAKEACEQLYNMIDANTRLSAFSSNMGNVDKAYAEFKTSGYNTIDTLSSMQGAFGDLSYYEKFVQIAGNAKSSTEEIQQAYEKLVSEYVYSTGILDVVNEENKGMIQTQLEQLGITNAEEIVTKALNNEIMSLAEAKAILTQYGYDLNTVTSEEINKLIHEGKVSNTTAEQIATLALKKKLANGATIKTDGDIANLVQLANVSADVVDMLFKVANIKERLESGVAEAGTASGRAWLESEIANYNKKINKHLNKKQKTNIDYTGGTATTDAIEKANKKSTKSTTKFSQAIDWCTQTLSKLGKSIDLFSAKLESNTNSVKTQIKYYKQLLNAQNNIIKGYAKTEKKYNKKYQNSLSKLSDEDRKKVEDGTYTIEQFKGKAKSGKKSSAEKRYNNIQDALESRDNLLDAQVDLVNAQNQFEEYAEALVSVRWEKATEKVEKLNGELDLLELKASNAVGSLAKNSLVDEQLANQKASVKKQRNALKKTQFDADSVYSKISSKYKKNTKTDGTIKTKGITDKKQLSYIKLYNAYVKELADDTLELTKAEEEYKSAQREAILTKAENIQSEYDMKMGQYETKQNRIQDKIALAEAQGKIIGKAYYTSMIASAQKSIPVLEAEMKELQQHLTTINPNTNPEEWYEVAQQISECSSNMDNLKASTEEWNTTMQEIETSAFDDLITKFQKLNDEADFYIELLENSGDLFDENGNMTDLGNAKLGLLYSNYLTSQNKGDVAGKKAERFSSYLSEAEANGSVVIDGVKWTVDELEDKITSLKETQQDAISSMYDYKDTILDLIEEGINVEIEATEELIEKKKEALESERELDDFRKKVADSNQDIALIERQLSALEGDNSDEARKKRRELEAQKSDAEENRQELLKEQAITMQTDSLDEALEQFEADMEAYLETVKTDLSSVSKIVNNNLPTISGTLKNVLGKIEYIADKDISFIIDTNNGTVEKNTNTVTKGYETEATNEQKKAEEEATQNITTVSTEPATTSTVSNALDNANEQSKLNAQILDIIKSGTKTKKSEADDKKANGEYKYRDVNRYLIKKYGYRINQKKQTEIARLLGMTGATEDNITNIKKQIKLLEKLQVTGFSSGGLVKVDDLNSIVRANGDDGLATVKKDEYVLTPVQSQSFLDFAKISPDLLQASNTLIDGLKFNPVLPTNIIGNAQPQNIDASVNIQVQGNADATTVKDIRKIAEDVVAKQQKEIQRQAYNRGMRLR